MGQILHGSAKSTHAIRRAQQRSTASIAEFPEQYDINPKTVMKWRARESVEDRKTGPKDPRSTVLTPEEEALCVAFRKHTLLPLDDCLYALQATIPHLTRSLLHRLFQRHNISRLLAGGGGTPQKTFKAFRWDTITSTSRRCVPKKANSTCSLPLIARANSPLASSMTKLRARSPRPFLTT